jgi:hypothetical protein
MDGHQEIKCTKCGHILRIRDGQNVIKTLAGHKTWCNPRTNPPFVYQDPSISIFSRFLEMKRNSNEPASKLIGADTHQDGRSSESRNVHILQEHVEASEVYPPNKQICIRPDISPIQPIPNSSMESSNSLESSQHLTFEQHGLSDIDGRLAMAKSIAIQTDVSLSTFTNYPPDMDSEAVAELSLSEKRESAIEGLREIRAEFKLRTRVMKRLVAWVNKFFVPADQPKFSLRRSIQERRGKGRNERNQAEGKNQLPSISPQTDVILYGKGLPGSPSEGYRYELVYCDPLSIIARRVVSILHRYGRSAFEVSSASSDFGTAQQSELLRKASRQLADPSALIVPVKVCADGAHMRGNGLHHVTPIMISVIHRDSFKEHTYPDLVTSVITHDSGSMKKLNPSLHHGILDALFGPLRSVANRMKSFVIMFHGAEIRCYPMIYKLAMDMPMVATCSLTKLSRPAQQFYPCQQCLTPGRNRGYFLSPTEPVSYRLESRMLEMLVNDSRHVDRQKYALRRVGHPMFVNMCPFDSRGIFLLAAADGLHAFQGMWFRGIINLALYSFYRYKDMPEATADGHPEESLSLPPDDVINPRRLTCTKNLISESSSSDSEFDYLPSNSLSSTQENVSDDGTRSDDTAFTGDERQPPESDEDVFTNHKMNRGMGALAVGDISKRINEILRSQRGQALVAKADRLVSTLRKSKGSEAVPIRHYNVFKQLTKIQEHKYSLGYLYSVMAIIGCDTSRGMMGKSLRKQWLSIACKCIRIYALLYQCRPTTEGLHAASSLIREVLSATEQLEQMIGFEWWPPKKHLLIHFPDMIRMFGRMRLFDTAEGENGISNVKRCYNTICNRDVFHNFQRPLLERMDTQSRLQQMAIHLNTFSNRLNQREDLSWKLHAAPFKTSVRFKILNERESVLLTREQSSWPLDIFPLKADEPLVTTVESIESSLTKYITYKVPRGTGATAALSYHAAAIRFDENSVSTTLCASNVRYGRLRHDFVSYRFHDSIRYGQIITLASLEIGTKREVVAFVSVLQTDRHYDISQQVCRCIDFEGILIHGRVRRIANGSKAIECIPLTDVLERVTVFQDTSADWRAPSAGDVGSASRLWPHGEWFFIIAPDTFKGVERYN